MFAEDLLCQALGVGRVPTPMLATAGRPPPDPADLWAVEAKWDGMRVITGIDGEDVRFYSHRGREVTTSFPELAAAVADAAAGWSVIVDGEAERSTFVRGDHHSSAGMPQ